MKQENNITNPLTLTAFVITFAVILVILITYLVEPNPSTSSNKTAQQKHVTTSMQHTAQAALSPKELENEKYKLIKKFAPMWHREITFYSFVMNNFWRKLVITAVIPFTVDILYKKQCGNVLFLRIVETLIASISFGVFSIADDRSAENNSSLNELAEKKKIRLRDEYKGEPSQALLKEAKAAFAATFKTRKKVCSKKAKKGLTTAYKQVLEAYENQLAFLEGFIALMETLIKNEEAKQ